MYSSSDCGSGSPFKAACSRADCRNVKDDGSPVASNFTTAACLPVPHTALRKGPWFIVLMLLNLMIEAHNDVDPLVAAFLNLRLLACSKTFRMSWNSPYITVIVNFWECRRKLKAAMFVGALSTTWVIMRIASLNPPTVSRPQETTLSESSSSPQVIHIAPSQPMNRRTCLSNGPMKRPSGTSHFP